MSDNLLPPMTEVKVTDNYHIALAYKYVGAESVIETLEALRDEYPKLPGMALCLATAKAQVTTALGRLTAKNILLASKHGFDPQTQKLSMEQREDGFYLVATADSSDD